MPLSAGDKLGPYEILSPIGAGGMGEVYRAHDPRLGRDVAIKVSAQFSDRFEREARAIAALNHPHICQVYDIGPNYLVMEFIEGTPLAGPLPLDLALRHAAQIADALSAAHAKGITHRDLKPANILVTASGIKLLDFGLALLSRDARQPAPTDATATIGMTKIGTILGTAAYMSLQKRSGAAPQRSRRVTGAVEQCESQDDARKRALGRAVPVEQFEFPPLNGSPRQSGSTPLVSVASIS